MQLHTIHPTRPLLPLLTRHPTVGLLWLTAALLMITGTSLSNIYLDHWALLVGLAATIGHAAALASHVVNRLTRNFALWTQDVPLTTGGTGLHSVTPRTGHGGGGPPVDQLPDEAHHDLRHTR